MGSVDILRRLHQSHQANNEIVDIAEGPRLRTVPVNRDVRVAKGLAFDDQGLLAFHFGKMALTSIHDASGALFGPDDYPTALRGREGQVKHLATHSRANGKSLLQANQLVNRITR
jgi:hypothetical protein